MKIGSDMKGNIYLKIIRILIYASLFIPLIVNRDFLIPFLFGKLMIFRLIVGLMLVCYIPLAISQKKFRPKKNLLVLSIGIFVFIYLLTSFTGVSPYQSFWGTFERMGGWYNFFLYWLFFLIITNTIKTRQEWMEIFKLSIVVSILACFYGFGQRTEIDFFLAGGGRAKIVGTIGNAALFAGYILFNFFLSFWFLLKKDTSLKSRFFYGAACLIQAVAIFMTTVRGSILALLGGMVLTLLLYGIFYRERNKKVFVLSLLVIALLAVVFFFLWLARDTSFIKDNSYLSRIANISLKAETIQTRLVAWRSGFKGWKEKFWLGWGPENFGIIFAKYFEPKFFVDYESEVLWDRAHNMFLEVGATMGMLGLLSYLSIFVVIFYLLIKSCFKDKKINKLDFSIFLSLFLAYIVHNSFIFDSFSSYLMFFIVTGYIGVVTQKDKDVEEIAKQSTSSIKTIVIFAILIILFLIISYSTVWRPAKANYITGQAVLMALDEKYPIYSIDKFKQALSYNTFGKYEIRNKAAQYILLIAGLKKLNIQEKKKALELIIEAEKKNVQEFPNDYVCQLYLARLYDVHYAYFKEEAMLDLGEQAINEAFILSPNFPRNYFELGQIKILRNDYQSAIELLRQAVALNPDAPISHWYLGLALAEFGDIEEGLSEINKAIELGYNYKARSTNIERLRKIYTELEDYGKVAELYEKAIELEPDDAQLYASLAVAYEKSGQIDKAIEAARKIGEIDPELKPEADAFIHQLETKYK
jgi:O-antigen ligase/tetratricopeptide (TPR) repeat protein